jgi:hypothetical protein
MVTAVETKLRCPGKYHHPNLRTSMYVSIYNRLGLRDTLPQLNKPPGQRESKRVRGPRLNLETVSQRTLNMSASSPLLRYEPVVSGFSKVDWHLLSPS